MKSILFLLSLSINSFSNATFSSGDLQAISAAVHTFVENADQRNFQEMDKILHKDFRALINRQFGSEEVSIMDKSLYLNLLKEGKIGGDQREITIHTIHVDGNNAVVRAEFSGKQFIFTTFIQLVKDKKDNWTIISDMPVIEKKE